MHCSTGPSYLIVNGDQDITATDVQKNTVWALPLVDDPTNLNPCVHGALANKGAALVNNRFVAPAAAPGDLANSTTTAAQVGAGPLPIDPNILSSTMIVLGDTVYISIDNIQNATNDNGIFYSQAIFEQDGKIAGWTAWTKRAFPWDGFPNAIEQGSVFSFGVDAASGIVWAVDGDTQTQVRISQWGQATTGISLVGSLNQALGTNPCCSALDLDQSIKGFTDPAPANATTSRYALFGGNNSVIFTRPSVALGTLLNSPQTVTTDFSNPANFLVTKLPTLACSPTTLTYSQRTFAQGAQNYFFAGTSEGLFVYANQGGGIVVNTLGALNAAPFTTSSWQYISAIMGSVLTVQTVGNTLYVLTYSLSGPNTILSQVYRIDFASTVSAMFAPANIVLIAQAGTLPALNNFSIIYDIQVMPTSPTSEQLILATNNGLYGSTRAGGVQAAINQGDASWILIPGTAGTLYPSINSPQKTFPNVTASICWPLALADQFGFNTFERSNILQIALNVAAGPYGILPTPFNSEDPSPAFSTISKSNFVWSDGNRRIFISPTISHSPSTNQLIGLPYRTLLWNIGYPEQFLMDTLLGSNLIQAYHWVMDVGATGNLLAGTNHGVVALS
jgi:hypothetical protein